MRFILISPACAAYNDMLLQTQSIHTQTLLPKPCNFCHVSFGQQQCWVEVLLDQHQRLSGRETHWRRHMESCAGWFAALEVPSTYVATHDEWLKAIKADSGGLLTPSWFNELEYCSYLLKPADKKENLQSFLVGINVILPWETVNVLPYRITDVILSHEKEIN